MDWTALAVGINITNSKLDNTIQKEICQYCWQTVKWLQIQNLFEKWKEILCTRIYIYKHTVTGKCIICPVGSLIWFMVFNATFNNILGFLWRSVLLVEETGIPGENHRPVASDWHTLWQVSGSSAALYQHMTGVFSYIDYCLRIKKKYDENQIANVIYSSKT